jgi:hypothetical protein
MTEQGWQPVTGADGEVLGWMAALDDPVVIAGERERGRRIVRLRADAIGQVAELLMDEAFDPEETWDAAEASGLPPGVVDAAGNVAFELWKIEHAD